MACEAPCELVAAGWSTSQVYARDAYNSAINFLDSISSSVPTAASLDIPNANLTVTMPTPPGADFSKPAAPARPDISFNEINAPAAPVIAGVPDIDVGTAPSFIADYPTISLPTPPTALSGSEPGDAPTLSAITLPVSPSYTIPATPTLESLSLPDAPTITLPAFEGTAPTDDIGEYIETFNYSEDAYSSSLLTEINGKLLSDIQNGTAGLPTAIETAIWDRARSRENPEFQRARKAAVEEFASRGFELPPGALAARLQEVEQDNINKSSTLSRDGAINQAERALQQLQFALTTALQSETQLMTYNSQVQQRALEAETTLATIGLQVYQAKAQVFLARVQAYQGYAEVFKARVQAELYRLEQYKAELEGQKLIGEINLQQIDAYKASLAAVQSIVDVYKTEMEAASIEADVQKIQLDAFRAEVEAYTARVGAKATEYQGYTAQVEGEVAKIRLYEGEVNAYNSRINAYRTLVEAETSQQRSTVDLRKLDIDVFNARMEAFKAQVAAESERVRSVASAYSEDVRAFSAEVSAEAARVDAGQKQYQTSVEAASTEAELRLKEAETNIQKAINSLQLMLQAAQSGAGVSQQLAAAALSMVNLSGSVSGSDTTSYNYYP